MTQKKRAAKKPDPLSSPRSTRRLLATAGRGDPETPEYNRLLEEKEAAGIDPFNIYIPSVEELATPPDKQGGR